MFLKIHSNVQNNQRKNPFTHFKNIYAECLPKNHIHKIKNIHLLIDFPCSSAQQLSYPGMRKRKYNSLNQQNQRAELLPGVGLGEQKLQEKEWNLDENC